MSKRLRVIIQEVRYNHGKTRYVSSRTLTVKTLNLPHLFREIKDFLAEAGLVKKQALPSPKTPRFDLTDNKTIPVCTLNDDCPFKIRHRTRRGNHHYLCGWMGSCNQKEWIPLNKIHSEVS